jgi:drug/metabolite transporter (DMT)-like permease
LAQPLPPLLITALAFAAAGLLGLAVIALREGWAGLAAALRQPPLAWAHGVGGLGGYHALYFAALAWAPPVEANLINYSWPLLIVLLAAPLRGLQLGPQRLAGVALGALGAVVLLGSGAGFPAGAWPGFACAFAAGLTWALYSVMAGTHHLARVPTTAIAGFCLGAAALCGVGHIAFEPAASLTLGQAGLILLLGTGPMGAAFFLWDIGMKRGDPRLLGTLAYATPVASTLLLVGFGEGALTPRILAAATLVAGGGLLAALAPRDPVTTVGYGVRHRTGSPPGH